MHPLRARLLGEGDSVVTEENWNDPFSNDEFDRAVEAQAQEELIRLLGRQLAEQSFHDQQGTGFSYDSFAKQMIDGADIGTGELEMIPYIVKHLLNRKSVAFMHGGPGVGKSACALDLCLHAAVLAPEQGHTFWCGYKIKRAKVLYVYSEGVTGLDQRIRAWRKKHAIAPEALRGRITIYPEPIPLNASHKYIEALTQYATEGAYDLIVVDTWATATAGADENSAKEMGIVLGRAGAIRTLADVTVLAVHHDNRGGTFRGSSAIDGYVDARLHLIRIVDRKVRREDRIVEFLVAKQRDAPDGYSWRAHLEQIELGHDEEGDPVTSVVYRRLDDDDPLVTEADSEGKANHPWQIVWNFVRDHDAEYTRSDIDTACSKATKLRVREARAVFKDLLDNRLLETRKEKHEGDRQAKDYIVVSPRIAALSEEAREVALQPDGGLTHIENTQVKENE